MAAIIRKVTEIGLGDNADPTKNFKILVPDVADGTLKITRGDGTAVLSIDAAGKLTATALNSPQTVKAYCIFDGYLAGTNAPLSGFNVASVTRVSVGVYEVNFDSEFSDNAYAVNVTSDADTTGLIAVTYYAYCTKAKAQVRTYSLTPVAADSGRVVVTIFKVGA